MSEVAYWRIVLPSNDVYVRRYKTREIAQSVLDAFFYPTEARVVGFNASGKIVCALAADHPAAEEERG